MDTTPATTQDLEILRRDVENRFALLEQRIKTAMTRLDQRIEALRGDSSRELAALDVKMTVKLGSMLIAGFGLTIAALRLRVSLNTSARSTTGTGDANFRGARQTGLPGYATRFLPARFAR